jgi:hypothetical protein
MATFLLRALLAVFTLLRLSNVYEPKASYYTKSFFDESNLKFYQGWDTYTNELANCVSKI